MSKNRKKGKAKIQKQNSQQNTTQIPQEEQEPENIRKTIKKMEEKHFLSAQEEIKRFEHKMIFIILSFFLIILLLLYGFLYMQKKNLVDNSRPVEPVEETESEEVVEETRFKSILKELVSDVSVESNAQYALDENYYDEEDMITYISIMSGVSPESITKDVIRNYFWNIFIPIDTEEGIGLIKKDNKTLILECADKVKMNQLDYAFMGTTNDEIVKASKGFYISQNDEKFASVPYGTADVRSSGCGPISLTMALNYVSGTEIVKLEDVLRWAEANNMYEENAGTRWSLVRNFPSTVAAISQEMHITNIEAFATSLQEGEVLVTSMRKGQFTEQGHFIVITGIKDGKVSVLDSTSICRSLKQWDIETIFNESNKYFWKISR